MKIIKRKTNKICPCCGKRFFRPKNKLSNKQWKDRIWCSGKCREQKVPLKEYKEQRLKKILSRTVITKSGCMEWIGCLYPSGYAQIRAFGKQESGSRIVWKLFYGEIPKELWVLHSCDNRKCCNPEHLFLGTRQDNVNDMMNKERNYHKINKEQKQEIIQMAIAGIPYYKIAEKFNVSAMIPCGIAKENGIHRR